MPIDLAAILDPAHTAIVTSEVQNGVVGEPSALPALADAARAEMLPNLARLLPVARAAGVQVVHCTAYRRSDGKGANRNARLFAGVRKSPVGLTPGTSAVSLLPELGPEPEDLVLTRTHGLNPMGGTDLDPVLRNLGVRTIVPTGVSVNVAITNLVMDAVNAGYDVVLPRDAVAGLPKDYADAMIDNTLALLATIVTTDDLVAAWA
ncbi:MAG TPA: cysteine hydrolase [Acidimicrobiales bacterium]|nr:cysteine hydrolase [Acidimicrobiales bacterium]